MGNTKKTEDAGQTRERAQTAPQEYTTSLGTWMILASMAIFLFAAIFLAPRPDLAGARAGMLPNLAGVAERMMAFSIAALTFLTGLGVNIAGWFLRRS